MPRFSYLCAGAAAVFDVGPNLGVVPAAQSSSSIDFPLFPARERAQFDVLLLADTQPANTAEIAYLRDDIIKPACSHGAAFGINHGDVVFDDLSLYPGYLQVLSASGIPWHHCPGNHDIDVDARDDRMSRETWKRALGPRHYAFQHASATFIVLVCYFGRSSNGTPGGYCGRIGEDQLRFVRNVLAHVPRNALVVLSMHIPLVTYQDAGSAADNTSDVIELLSLLSSHPYSVSFSGHMHSTEHHYLRLRQDLDGPEVHHHHVLTAASGSWWGGPKDARGIPAADSPDGNPNGFHVLSIDSSNYSTRFVPAPEKASGQMRVVVESPFRDCASGSIPASALSQCALLANVFDGGPRTRVAFEIAGAGLGPQPMRRTTLPDPFVAGKPWARSVPSSHVWKAPLPAGLSAGAHLVTVRARDEYGRSITVHHDLKVG